MASSSDAGNSESRRGFLGINRYPTTIVATRKTGTCTSVAGAQIVVASRSVPISSARKCPGVATRSGALADSPNCQIEWAPARIAWRNRKSTGSPLSSACRAKWMAIIGPSATPRPQLQYATNAAHRDAPTTTWSVVRGSREAATTMRLKNGDAATTRLTTRMSVICIANESRLHRPW